MEHLDSTSETEPDWKRLHSVLDEAMSELAEPDYDALVMRFFKNQDLRSVGVSDDTAQKRPADTAIHSTSGQIKTFFFHTNMDYR